MKSWYLLYCKSRGESRAQQNLAQQGIESYLPSLVKQVTVKGETSLKKVPLFPSYLFIYFDPLEVSVSRIHSTRGAVRIVGCKEVMTPIHEAIISSIKQQEAEMLQKIKQSQNQSPAAVAPDFAAGDKVRFTQGPFTDLEGIFAEKSGDKRCHILFNIMGKQQKITVNTKVLAPA